MGGYKGRIIFLGDGTEVLTDSDDTEMFDNTEEDKDLASQVSKTSHDDVPGGSAKSDDNAEASVEEAEDIQATPPGQGSSKGDAPGDAEKLTKSDVKTGQEDVKKDD